MAKIRMIVIEGDMSVEDVQRLAKGFSAGDEAFTSVTLPSGVTAQAATLNNTDDQPRPRPLAVPVVVEDKPVHIPVVEAPKAPEPAVPPAIAKVFPEAVVEPEPSPAASSLVDDLLSCKRLSGIIERLQKAGHTDTASLIAACKTHRDSVPLLQRLGEGLEDRVTRTLEGMK